MGAGDRELRYGFGQRARTGPGGRLLALGLLGAGIALSGSLPPLAHAVEAEAWQYLPGNTALVLLIDTTPDTWGQLSQFQLFKLFEDGFDFTPTPLGLPYLPYGIDFAREVAPWVGDAAVVALLPAPPDTAAPLGDHTIMVAPVANTEAFERFRATFFEFQAGTPEITAVLGTDIYFWPAPELEESAEMDPLIPPACGPAEVGAEPCKGAAQDIPENLEPENLEPETGKNGSADEVDIPPLKARSILRLSGGTSLPLTVSPLHHGAEAADEFEVDMPVPLPGFGPAGLAVAFLPEALVTAESPAAIEQYLHLRQVTETRQTQTSLANSREFQRTLTNSQAARAFVAVYGNALELLNYDFSATVLPDVAWPLPLPPTPSLDADTLQTLRSLNFGGTLEGLVYPLDQGIQVRGRYYYDAVPFTLGLTPMVANADSPLELLPASTFLVMSGRNVAGFWRGLSSILANASDFTRQGLETVRSGFTLFTGLDLDDDLFGWMDGEVAIAAFPTEGGPLQYAGLGLLVQTSDRPTAENTLTVIDDLLPGFGMTVTPRTVNQQPATSWELLSSWSDSNYSPELSVGSHAWVTDDTLALTSGAVPMAQVLAPSPHDPLVDFFLFDQATATFPNPNNGYFYLNVGATLSLAYQMFGLHDEPAFDSIKPYLGSVRSLSATTTQTPRHLEINGQLGLAPRRD